MFPGLPLALTPGFLVALIPGLPLALIPELPLALTPGLPLGPQPYNPFCLGRKPKARVATSTLDLNSFIVHIKIPIIIIS